MYHLDNDSSVVDMPQTAPVLFTERRWFTEGGDGIQPSYPGADWFNIIQAEMMNVLALANITPDKTQHDQFAQAIRYFSSDFMIPPGIPLPWPGATAPNGFAFMLGQTFDVSVYPRLAIAYPNGVIPDMRGQVIKFLPSSGRELLSYELDGNKSHNHEAVISETDLGTVSTTENGRHNHINDSRFNKLSARASDLDGTNSTVGSDDSGSDSEYRVAGMGDFWSNATMIDSGQHSHSVYIGPHLHSVVVNNSGNQEVTVKNIAFNAIVRLI